MFRHIAEEIVEAVGPLALKVLAAIAGLVVFAPLSFALIAPVLWQPWSEISLAGIRWNRRPDAELWLATGHPYADVQFGKSRVTKSPATSASDGDDDRQDDPCNVAEIERLRAKLARHRKEAERLAELIHQKEKNRWSGGSTFSRRCRGRAWCTAAGLVDGARIPQKMRVLPQRLDPLPK
jgi:hypothetical protein